MDSTHKFLRQTTVTILCGGQGSRMRSKDLHKVCFPIDGVPAINRTVEMFQHLGARKIVMVVGALADNVIGTVGARFPNVHYVYQHEQLGTGHAAQVAASALAGFDPDGPMLITMGDKVIDPHVIEELVELYARSRADLAFVTAAKVQDDLISGSGRIAVDKRGAILGNFEVRDIQRARILASLVRLAAKKPGASIDKEKILAIGSRLIGDPGKLNKALGPLLKKIGKTGRLSGCELLDLLGPHPERLCVGKRALTPDQVERQSKTVNYSIYLGSRKVWDRFLPRLNNDNAQGEFYLTDAINLAIEDAGKWKVVQHQVKDHTSVMAYNSPDELVRIEDIYRRKALGQRRHRTESAVVAISEPPRAMYRPAGKWLELFEQWPAAVQKKFTQIYGDDNVRDRRRLFIRALKLFVKRHGADRKALVVRAPGRINLLGRHIDHRGGAVNVMAIDRDVVFVAAPRRDDVVTLCNADRRAFPDRTFSLREVLGDIEWEDWLSYIDSEHVRGLLEQARGDWSNYIKSSLLRLQQSFHDVRIRGFDAAVAGDIPMAAGLSSSSALVVASAQLAVAFNAIEMSPIELVDMCGEGEWFVGSRGGAADHTAIRMSRRGQVSHIRFHPFRLGEVIDFPGDCRVIVAHSGLNARKSDTAKDKFNQKVASYELGLMLLKDRLPQYAHLLEHVRDLNPQRLNCSIREIYGLLRHVPESMELDTLREALSEQHRRKLERILSSHRPPRRYDLRGVLLFGASECARSLMASDLLARGEVDTFGRLMQISHDGDRTASFYRTATGKWRDKKYTYDCSDTALGHLCDGLAGEDPARVLDAQLYMQPGAYGCSLPQIDRMIDVVSSIPGVHGAQLGGAGLGGCVMILLSPGAVDTVRRSLVREYYEPAGIDPLIHVCQPVEGSGPLAI